MCGVIAVAIAIFKEHLRFSRKQEIRLLARQMSLRYSARGSQTIVDRLKRLTGRDRIFSVNWLAGRILTFLAILSFLLRTI